MHKTLQSHCQGNETDGFHYLDKDDQKMCNKTPTLMRQRVQKIVEGEGEKPLCLLLSSYADSYYAHFYLQAHKLH